jgi:16S rRNA (uracil1498-N3)-methyltransferase
LGSGDTIHVLNNEGWEFEVEIQSTRRDQVTGQVLKRWRVASEPQLHLTLFQSRLRQNKFELILQKGTELGAASFVPVVTERSLNRQMALKQNKKNRWQRIIREAAEQSGRGLIPELTQPLDFDAALEAAQTSQLAMIPWTGEKEKSIPGVLAASQPSASQPMRSIALFLGPEGGFSEAEIQAAQAANIIPITLGPRILRAETAAIVAITLAMSAAGEMELTTGDSGKTEN